MIIFPLNIANAKRPIVIDPDYIRKPYCEPLRSIKPMRRRGEQHQNRNLWLWTTLLIKHTWSLAIVYLAADPRDCCLLNTCSHFRLECIVLLTWWGLPMRINTRFDERRHTSSCIRAAARYPSKTPTTACIWLSAYVYRPPLYKTLLQRWSAVQVRYSGMPILIWCRIFLFF